MCPATPTPPLILKEGVEMGTDIHGIFQRHDPASGKWEDVASTYDEDRDYQLFAVLAGVHNGYGFAGVKTGEPVVPIAEPRGLPDDFEADGDEHPVADTAHLAPYQLKYREPGEPLVKWMGDHSHSWLTGEEMAAWFAEAPTVLKTGLVTRECYAQWSKAGRPEAYCGGASGPGVVIVEDNAVAMARCPNWTYVRVYWEGSLKDDLAYFFDEVARLAKEHDRVRYVFGFDS